MKLLHIDSSITGQNSVSRTLSANIVAAFKAATHILIPAQMEEYSIQGIYGMLQLWKQETYSRDQDNPIELIGILPNKFRGVNLHRDFLEGLKNAPGIAEFVMPCFL